MERLGVFAGGKAIPCYRVSMHTYKTAGLTNTTTFADLNGDARVDIDDLLIFAEQWLEGI